MRKLLLALVAAVLMAAPAFAAVQNVKVSGDIDSWYVNRQDFNFGATGNGTGSATANPGLSNQSVFLTQTRLRVDADLSDNVSTTVGLINERAWAAEGSTDTNVQLYLAYATLREFLYSPLTVSVGRQVFAYGNGLVMGDGGANNVATGNLAGVAADLTKRTSYDGVKAIFDYKPLTIDLIYFKNSSGVVTGADLANNDESNVYGINANYQLGDSMNTVVEGYVFSRFNKDNGQTSSATHKGDTLFVPGLRVSTNPIKGLNTQAELAWQGGNKTVATGVGATTDADSTVRREAMAAQFLASYAIPVAELEKYKTTVNGSYTYVSGDKNSNDGRLTPGTTPSANPRSGQTFKAWDVFNEAQGSGTVYNSLFDLTNMHIFSASVQASPIQDVTAQFVWSGLWLDKKVGTSGGINNSLTFRQPDGSSVAPVTTSSKNLGNEYDLNFNYNYTEDVLLGVSLGWFVPGNTFANANDSTASQALAHVNVNF